MIERTILELIKKTPLVFDRAAADESAEKFTPFLEKIDDAIAANGLALIRGVAGCSPYLKKLMEDYPAQTFEFLQGTLWEALQKNNAMLRACVAHDTHEDQYRALRKAKKNAALIIGLSDIAGAIDVMSATAAL